MVLLNPFVLIVTGLWSSAFTCATGLPSTSSSLLLMPPGESQMHVQSTSLHHCTHMRSIFIFVLLISLNPFKNIHYYNDVSIFLIAVKVRLVLEVDP